MSEFLLEIFSEEVPARMQRKAQNDLQEILKKELAARDIPFDSVTAESTPRRLIAVATGIPAVLPETRQDKQGPKAGSDPKIIEAFTKGNNIAADDLFQKEMPKGTYYFFTHVTPARDTRDVLPAVIDAAIRALQWPKSMRWAHTAFRWPRPLLRILAVYNGEAVAGSFDLGGGHAIPFGNVTSGHRFLDPADVVVKDYADYASALEKRHVFVTRDQRRDSILAQIAACCADKKLTLVKDDALLEEVVGLVEYPVVMTGKFDDDFLALPAEVISTSMRVNQKYFSLMDGQKLSSRFIFVSNMKTDDDGATTIKGNEKVIRARLADANFFWQQDIKMKLDDRIDTLDNIKFHEKLGSMKDKTGRIARLAADIAATTAPAAATDIKRAAVLAKTDLTTSLVFEFPELQGIIGSYIAQLSGENDAVVQAVKTHYMPQGPQDDCPQGPVAAAVALADKIDNLTGFFSIGEIPTSSKDPFALRRAALGAVRILIENDIDADLNAIVAISADTYGAAYPEKIDAFMRDRIRYTLIDLGCNADAADAVLAVTAGNNPVQILRKTRALQEFAATPDGMATINAATRVGNILAAASKSGKKTETPLPQTVDAGLLKEDAEKELHAVIASVAQAQHDMDFDQALKNLTRVNKPLDAFFDNVLVNDEDAQIRANRLALLTETAALFNGLADFKKIKG